MARGAGGKLIADCKMQIANCKSPKSAVSIQQFAFMLGLYVHVPFCSAICNYCNFNRGLFYADLKTRYVDALVSEIRNQSAIRNPQSAMTPTPSADTIYFGGGTPSLLEPDEIARIIRACGEAFDVSA